MGAGSLGAQHQCTQDRGGTGRDGKRAWADPGWQVQFASASRVHALGDRGFGLMRTKLESGETVRRKALRQ